MRSLEGAPTSDWWIILDFDRHVQAYANESESTEELGVILAASLAERGLLAHHSVGMLASGKEPVWMRPESGKHRRWEILRALALLNPGETRLANFLENAGPAMGHQATLIIITSSMESDWLKPLASLFWRGFTPTVISIDPTSFDAPSSTLANVGVFDKLLRETNISFHVVTRDLFKQPDIRPGPRGQWEWRIMPTGKAIPVRTPDDLTWKRLR